MKRTTKINRNDPNFFPHNHRSSVYQHNQKCIEYQLPNFTCGTKHVQIYIYSRPHVKGTSSIRIGQKNLYEWTHDTFTKVPRYITGNN